MQTLDRCRQDHFAVRCVNNGSPSAGSNSSDIGFLPRFLICEPISTIGTRLHAKMRTDDAALNSFTKRLLEILETVLPIAPDTGGLNTCILPLSDQTHAQLVRFADEFEIAQAPHCNQYDGISLVGDVFADLIEMKLHRFGIGLRQDECGTGSALWTDSAEQLGVVVTLVGRQPGPGSFPRPDAHLTAHFDRYALHPGTTLRQVCLWADRLHALPVYRRRFLKASITRAS